MNLHALAIPVLNKQESSTAPDDVKASGYIQKKTDTGQGIVLPSSH